jgi:protoporphyrinogen oxidase
MAPPGHSNLYVELTDRHGDPDLPVIFAALVEMGALASVDDVLFAQVRDIEYAYVVFDQAHASATRIIRQWLETCGVRSCGRYGAWIYNSMEDSIIEGMEAAAWAVT